jgi:hypothetical protein
VVLSVLRHLERRRGAAILDRGACALAIGRTACGRWFAAVSNSVPVLLSVVLCSAVAFPFLLTVIN